MTDPVDKIAGLLHKADSPASPIRPTDLYNEGWMLRLLLDWACENEPSTHPFTVMPGGKWYSEALDFEAAKHTRRG